MKNYFVTNGKKNQGHKTTVLFIFLLVVIAFGLSACATTTPMSTMSVLNSTSTSTQLLKNRSVGVLHDRLTVQSVNESCKTAIPRLSIFNRSAHTLTIQMDGSGGSYTLLLEPKSDHTWLIREGTYHVEVNVPGFPPAAGDGLSISRSNKYKWEIGRGEPSPN